MVFHAEVAEFQGEPDQVRDEVGGMDPAVDEDGAVDVGVTGRGIDGGLTRAVVISFASHHDGLRESRLTSIGTSWSSMLPMNVTLAP